jgi:hypothetical protein
MDIEVLLLGMFERKRENGEEVVTCAKEERNGFSFFRDQVADLYGAVRTLRTCKLGTTWRCGT